MKGTSFSHTFAIDLMPPRMTTAVQMVITGPVSHGLTPKVSNTIAEIEFACTMLPMPKAAIAVRAANTTPSHRMWRPRSSAYIGPPAIAPCGVVMRYLMEHGLSVLGRDAEDARQPHPEDGARTARGHRRRDADDVAGADGRGERGGERAEVAHVAFALGRARKGEPDRRAEVALDDAQADGQVEVRADEEDEERPAPHQVAERVEDLLDGLHQPARAN